MFFSKDTLHNLEPIVNQSISQLHSWLISNKLELNTDKTAFVHFNKRYLEQDPLKIHINDVTIKEVAATKFLGIWIDSDLTWDVHISKLVMNLCQTCYAIRILSKITNFETLRTVYFGYVYSKISYGIPLWGSASKAAEVFKWQKRILKIIKQVSIRSPSKPIFQEFNILPLPCIYILETVKFVHKNIEYFAKNNQFHNYDTRISTHIHLNHHRTTRSLHSIAHRGVILYNKLPQDVKSLNLPSFKKRVKCLLLKHLFYSSEEYLSTAL